MAYDEALASKIRGLLSHRKDVVEKKMFGGITFMVSGHMCCGINTGQLLARVGPGNEDTYLSLPHVKTMNFTGRPMKGFVWVKLPEQEHDTELGQWVDHCLSFVATLPVKGE